MNENNVTKPPRQFYVWLCGALLSILGDAVMYFSLGWAAAEYGGAVAGIVLTAINLPRVCLLIVGGTVGDRIGARRVMITGDAVMLVGTAALAIGARAAGSALWLLVAAGLLVGIKDAFYLPASGTMPLRLVGRAHLPRALAMRQSGAQLVTIVAGPLAGLLMASIGLSATAALNALTFAVILTILLLVKPRFDVPPARSDSFLHATADGVRVAAKDPVLRAAVLLTGSVAGFLVPVIPLLVPLLARDAGWSATDAGLLFGAQSAGLLVTTLTVVKRGTFARSGAAACAGLLVAAAGVGLLTLSGSIVMAGIAAAIVGVGSAICATHIGPLVLRRAPDTHTARIQALLTLVQSVALLAMNNVLGNLAGFATPTVALATCAAAIALVGLAGLWSRQLRTATDTPPEPVAEEPAEAPAMAGAEQARRS